MGDNLSRRRARAKLAEAQTRALTLVCLSAVLIIVGKIQSSLRWEACRDEGRARVDAA